MTEEECKHGLATATCTYCRPKVARPSERTMRARYGGSCPGCFASIAEGDTIALVDQQWLCWRCTT